MTKYRTWMAHKQHKLIFHNSDGWKSETREPPWWRFHKVSLMLCRILVISHSRKRVRILGGVPFIRILVFFMSARLS